jgi:glycosyltransferase involved in cell wall biosynthesis
MLAYTGYEFDNRVRRYAEELARRGDHVDVVALNHGDRLPEREEISGVTVYRIQNRNYNERHKWTFAWRLLRFLVVSSIFLARRHREVRYDLIHVHNIPDFLVFSAWYPKWTGTKLVLDIHDIVPELFSSKFKSAAGSLYVGFLKAIEKASAKFVDHVIVSNHLWQKTLVARSVAPQKCSVFLNNVDLSIFHPHPRTRDDGKVIILFPGSFQWHQGLDIAIKAFARVIEKVPNAEFHLYGGGGDQAGLEQLAQRLGVGESVKFLGGVRMDLMPDVIANADLGVVPKRADSFGNEAYSTKIMEFMSQGVPVVVSRTKIDSYYFDEETVRFFPSGDFEAMADAMVEVIENQSLRDNLVRRGYEYVRQNCWDTRKREYLALVDSLTTEAVPVPGVVVAGPALERSSQA